jgi:hypothetical protein
VRRHAAALEPVLHGPRRYRGPPVVGAAAGAVAAGAAAAGAAADLGAVPVVVLE